MIKGLLTSLGNSITVIVGGVATLLAMALMVTVGLVLVPRTNAPAKAGAVVKSLGPTTQQLERLSELASLRVNIVDVLQAEGEGHRGLWLIKGDALLTCDMTKARIAFQDEETRTATVRLSIPHCVSPRVDHEKTKTWSIEKSTWLPWKWGDQDDLRDGAMFHAQKLVEEAASSPSNVSQAKANAELLIKRTYEMLGWHVAVEWLTDS